MNLVVQSGNLVKDPELKKFSSGSCVCNFSIAVRKKSNRDNEDTADFFDCACWGIPGENLSKYFKGGNRIIVTGRLEQQKYTDKNGNKVSKVLIIVEEWQFGTKKQNDSSQGSNNSNQGVPFQDSHNGGMESMDDVGLPFN